MLKHVLLHPDGSQRTTLIAMLGDSGATLAYYLWLELHPDVPFDAPPGPAAVLHAMDGSALADRMQVSSLACWAVSG